eukprot:TRINITY_DN14116_c0_g1_i1.p2 TRINITY_DN14116_c0_g1~~TRINITY_DN14116_c0_g1_i1.p2  ORF type:complete len:172 (-),score=38.38 TRINITY_DN14116_c0_g1_i1:35-550(-)
MILGAIQLSRELQPTRLQARAVLRFPIKGGLEAILLQKMPNYLIQSNDKKKGKAQSLWQLSRISLLGKNLSSEKSIRRLMPINEDEKEKAVDSAGLTTVPTSEEQAIKVKGMDRAPKEDDWMYQRIETMIPSANTEEYDNRVINASEFVEILQELAKKDLSLVQILSLIHI